MILVNNPGSWSHLYPPLAHAPWHGVTPTDLVFPFFLFAVGNALAFVLPGLRAAGAAVFWRRVLLRTLVIFSIGLLLNASPFVRWDETGALLPRDWETLRLMGVLQRIALSFGAAAALVWLLPPRAVPWAAAALLVGYWLACRAFGDSAEPYSLAGWFGTAIDRALLGASHLYRGEGRPFDPEGLASTPPAVAQVLIGWWAGELVRRKTLAQAADAGLVAGLFLRALVLLAAAYVWGLEMPFNKKIWTSSYVLLTSGLALAALASLIHVVDIRRRPAEQWGWARVLEAFGRNPLFIFVLSGLVPRFLALWRWPALDPAAATPWMSPLPWLHQHVFADLSSDPRFGSLLYAVAHLACYALLAGWLDRRRIYLRV